MAKYTTNTDGRRTFSLIESLDEEWIKLPEAVMYDAGPAAQTLGGLLKLTNRETYVAAAAIAEKARVPLRTVRKHLTTLDAAGWIHNAGRQPTRSGHARRTATIKITTKTKDSTKPFGILPWWACCNIRGVRRINWSTQAVLAIVMAQLAKLKSAATVQDDAATDEEIQDFIEKAGGEDRFRFSLDGLHQATGLYREAIVRAKRNLHKLKIIRWAGTDRGQKGAACETDILLPNFAFRVVQTQASPGYSYYHFSEG